MSGCGTVVVQQTTPIVEVTSTQTSAVVEQTTPQTIVNATLASVNVVNQLANSPTLEPCPATSFEVAAPGPQGPAGTTGGETFNVVAGTVIFGGRVVRVENGLLYHPAVTTPDHAGQVVGIAEQSGGAGASILVRSKGVFVEPGAAYTDGPMYCGAAGVLLQTPHAFGWLMVVGRVLSTTSFDVDVETAFHRA